MKQVLCITLNPAIDMTIFVHQLQVGEVNRATKSQVDAAGKGLNVAQILSDLGVQTLASGFLGNQNAQIFEQLFAQKHGQMLDKFVKISGETRTNIKLVDDGVTTDVNGAGFMVGASDKQALFDEVIRLANQSDAVLIAGSLPKGYELDDFEQLLSALTKTDAKIAADVSGQALAVAMKYPLWLIKPNSDELTESFGVACNTWQAQQSLLETLNTPIDNIVISMGADGVHWFAKDGVWLATPPTVNVVSTVGAGDTLVAGMIAGLLDGLPHEQLLKRAVALSAHAVTIIGFAAASQDRLDDLMAQVNVSKLSECL